MLWGWGPLKGLRGPKNEKSLCWISKWGTSVKKGGPDKFRLPGPTMLLRGFQKKTK